MKRLISVVVVVAGLLAAAGACRAVAIGEPAPEIDAQYWLNAPALSLRALRGRIVVLEFWATWCGPCRATIPHLIELHKQTAPKGVVIVSLTSESRGDVERFAKQMGMIYAIGGGSRTSGQYGVRGIPHAVIVDPSGKVAWEGHPAGGLDRALEEQLKKTPPILVSPRARAEALAILERAEKALADQKHAAAAAFLAKVPKLDDPEVAKRTEAVRTALADAAAKALADGLAQAEAKQYAQAVENLERAAAIAPGSDPARQAEARLADLKKDPEIAAQIEKARRENQAAALLQDVLEGADKKPPLVLLRGLEQVAVKYPDTKAGQDAADRAKAMRADETLMAKAREADVEKECKGWMSMARNFIKAGMPEKAEPYLRQTIEKYGATPYAAEARDMLKAMGKQP